MKPGLWPGVFMFVALLAAGAGNPCHATQIVGIADKCLDVAGGNPDDGSAIQAWDCHGGLNQRWALLPSVIDR